MPTVPIPVRLTKDLIQRLDRVAESMGTNRTAIIKMCLLAYLQRFEKDGLSMLPTNWDDLLQSQDGRSKQNKNLKLGHQIEIKGDNNSTIVGDFKAESSSSKKNKA